MASGKKTLTPIPGTVKPIPGTMKQALSLEQTPRLKEMTSVYRDQSTLKLHGNRMAVPPLKMHEPMATESREVKVNSPGLKSASRSESGSSSKSQDSDKKELREFHAKERKLNQKIANLNKIIEDLKKQLSQKEKIIENKQQQLKLQEEDFKEKLLKETHSHIQTKCLLDQKAEQLTHKETELQKLQGEYEAKINKLVEEKAAELSKLRVEKDKEICVRDAKLGKLKKQMADVLMGNSKERQQQLEELTREISRKQEDIDTLTFKLRSYRNKQASSCPGCKDLSEEVTKTKTLSKSQDETIRELQLLCAKLEIQLESQDDILSQLADSGQSG